MRPDWNNWAYGWFGRKPTPEQAEVDRQNDLIAWRNLGTAWSKREPFVTLDGHRRCTHVDKSGHRCELWATHQKDGIKFCAHHKPEGAEKL